MTGLILQIFGILSTGLIYPNYRGVEPIVIQQNEIQQILQDEFDRNHQEEQKQIIINDYFIFLEKIGKINYARGCYGEYTPATWNGEKQKRVKCSANAFDCAGLIKAYAVIKGILTAREASHLNSNSMYELGTKKDPRTAERGDFTFWQGFGDRSTGNLSTHFAMVSRDYADDGILWIYDNVNGPNNNIVGERPIRVSYSHGVFYYLGKYKISVSSNGLVNVAQDNDIEVQPRIDVDKEEEEVTTYNPLGFSVTITGYAYDSIVNRVASFWYDNLPEDFEDLFGTMYGESAIDPEAKNGQGDSGLCQRSPIWHSEFINSTGFDDYMVQAKACMQKWIDIKYDSKRDNYRKAFKKRNNFKDMIIYMKK